MEPPMWLLLAGKAPAQNRHHEGWPGSGLGRTLRPLVGLMEEQTEPWPGASGPPTESGGRAWQDTSQN